MDWWSALDAGHCEQGAGAKGPLDAIYASLDAVVTTDAAQKQLNSPLNIAVGYANCMMRLPVLSRPTSVARQLHRRHHSR